MASKFFKAFNFFKSKASPTIKSVKPNVGKPSKSALNKQIQKTKASGAKLKQTRWESKLKKRFTFDKTNKRTKTSDEKRYEEAQIKKD